MKRMAALFAFTTSVAAVMPAVADAAVTGGGGCGGLPLITFLVPFW